MRFFKRYREDSNASNNDPFVKPTIQKKLKVGEPGDKYEIEADKMADQVVNKTSPGSEAGLQRKGTDEEIQQKPLAASVTPLVQASMFKEKNDVPVQKMEEEEPVQKMEEEEPVQKMEEEESVQKMEEEEPVQKMEEEEVQTKCEDCEKEESVQKMEEEEEVQTKPNSNSVTSSGVEKSSIESRLKSSKGKGRPISGDTKNQMESGFGADFSNVHIHTDSKAVQMSQEMGAQAFTHGNDVYFNKGKYNPESKEGKHLLAHELTHTIQQNGKAGKKVQRYKKDTGFRYSPPSTVLRSIGEIQAVVGTSPDGIYGINTKTAVENYQKKLKAAGLYTDTVDGKWGKNTEIAHVAFSTGSLAETYNCSGLAFKTFNFLGMTDTKSILSAMNPLANCSTTCNARDYKFWYWEYDLTITDTKTGASSTGRDFHIVGGQTDHKGKDPADVVSKNGRRPVKGPKSPMSWKPPASEIARLNTHKEPLLPHVNKTRKNMKQKCFCSSILP